MRVSLNYSVPHMKRMAGLCAEKIGNVSQNNISSCQKSVFFCIFRNEIAIYINKDFGDFLFSVYLKLEL